MNFIFPVTTPSVAIANSSQRFPVHRIYCVGKNYADHAVEMGGDPNKEPPCFFSKPADAVVSEVDTIPFPSRTRELHHEVELVLAIGKEAKQVSVEEAPDCVFGYAVGIDLTRRDLQTAAKNAGRPWDVAKGFDNSAPISAIHLIEETGYLENAVISLTVNGKTRQQGNIADMIWNVSEVIAELSTYFTLCPGDLIFTGTPAGVGILRSGDEVVGIVEGVDKVTVRFE
ncbi:MAG: fumarylacetoacetate hydrolase family protein [Gammaproteobacteria bacterium]|nr:fumarylacetoacetate hydrolase family protein [Gammaproteobacteria bacterium]